MEKPWMVEGTAESDNGGPTKVSLVILDKSVFSWASVSFSVQRDLVKMVSRVSNRADFWVQYGAHSLTQALSITFSWDAHIHTPTIGPTLKQNRAEHPRELQSQPASPSMHLSTSPQRLPQLP